MPTVNLTERELEIIIDALMWWYDPGFQYHSEEEYEALLKKLKCAL